jgi:serine/threonine-protein kinase
MNCYKCRTPIPDNSRFCSACGADVSGDSHDHVGDTIPVDQDSELFNKLQTELGDEYILERELGRGGMAVVYLGHDTRLGRKIAVKLLPPELTFTSKSMTERFKREAQTAAKLDHPNIIPVHRVSPGGKLIWYVMKYLDGEALNDILEREGQLSVERTVDIVSQVASALDYAHQNQVVHRDVKPANILVDRKGWCTVTDFGIAKALDADTLTASGSIIGTPYYMSPEQCKGKKVGPAADQYSLAVMTYQMLGGHLPFTGDSAVEIVHKHVADPVPPLGVLRANLSAKVIAVVERGLAKNAEERFATVAEFAAALKAAAQGLDITVAPPGKVTPVRMSKTALVSPVPGALRTARGTWRERKGLVFGTLGGLVVVAGIAGALVLRPWEPKTAAPGPLAASGLQLANGPAPGAQTPPASAPADSSAVRRDSAPAPVAAAPPPATQQRDRATPSRRETPPRTQRPSVSAPDRQAAQANRPAAPPAVQQQAAQPAGQPSQQAAPPASAPAAQPPASAAQPTTGFLSLGTQPVSTIYVNGAPRGSRLAHLEVPAGTVHLRFQVQDSTGIWWGPDRDVAVAPGESKVLGYIRLVRP